ncbi:MAG: NAD(P)H-dependent oxidoreductase subunit E [Candidatus Omnitrophota bacterium]|nr:NAD(P)H-dependent oxidoreductase subunit E [Candidatus Omnitrophota bacterium]MDZ4241409.1 NAD(P)H-dependent oxidoreductase subunit E [Candidatus Omnitrophota bacterium]
MIMAKEKHKSELPKDDPRTKLIMAAIKKEGNRPDALIQILHSAQTVYGYLPMNVIRYITRELRLPPSRVFGVVTFYHFFTLKQKGEHNCLVCTGTACYVKGAQSLLEEFEKEFHLKPGEVTEGNRFGLQVARCLGACGLAPAMVMDEVMFPRVKPEDIKGLVHSKIGAQK